MPIGPFPAARGDNHVASSHPQPYVAMAVRRRQMSSSKRCNSKFFLLLKSVSIERRLWLCFFSAASWIPRDIISAAAASTGCLGSLVFDSTSSSHAFSGEPACSHQASSSSVSCALMFLPSLPWPGAIPSSTLDTVGSGVSDNGTSLSDHKVTFSSRLNVPSLSLDKLGFGIGDSVPSELSLVVKPSSVMTLGKDNFSSSSFASVDLEWVPSRRTLLSDGSRALNRERNAAIAISSLNSSISSSQPFKTKA
mmetsp:Transcript_25251/g.41446  ORF Transcript_25251/g.41446 Transcript_25251/m.41446 type:complete len:251 (+) Transcript_25251:794-1546(+)